MSASASKRQTDTHTLHTPLLPQLLPQIFISLNVTFPHTQRQGMVWIPYYTYVLITHCIFPW